MIVEINDVGSFPLPFGVTKQDATKAATLFWKAYTSGKNFDSIVKNRFVNSKFIEPVKHIFIQKIQTGLDIPSYPQIRDMNEMFLNFLDSTLQIDTQKALIPELVVLEHTADEIRETQNYDMNIGVCVTGPLQLAHQTFKNAGMTRDILMRLSDSVKAYIQNAVSLNEYNVVLITIDEPYLGIVDLPVSDDIIREVLDHTLEDLPENILTAIHLHSFSRLIPILDSEKIQIIGGEFAGDPSNFSFVEPDVFREQKKLLRAGISMSAIDRMVTDYVETTPGASFNIYNDPKGLTDVVESIETIRNRYQHLKGKYHNLIRLVGPDCGLSSWIYPEVASLLLKRTVDAIKN